MKKTLLFSAAMLLGAGAYAQTVDMTPDRFDFSKQEVGEFKINYWRQTSNPANSFQPAYDGADAGYFMVCGPASEGQIPADGTEATSEMQLTIQKYTTIEDLGGEVGKVLCLKGPNSNASYGPTKATTLPVPGTNWGWFNYNFYAKTTGAADESMTMRCRLVYTVIGNSQMSDADVATYRMSTWTGTATSPVEGMTSPDWFCDPVNGPFDETTGEPIWDGKTWMVNEFDQNLNPEGIPTRVKFEIQQAEAMNACILIKEIKFTLNPEGEPVNGELVQYNMSSSVNEILNNDDVAAFYVSGNQVTFAVAGNVYNISGLQVADAAAGETVTLDRGIYVVKAGDKTEKLIVK